MLVAFGVQRDNSRRNILTFHGGTHRQRIVGHLAGQFELDVIGLELFLTGKRPVNLLTYHLNVERQSGFCQARLRTQVHIHRTRQIDADFQLFAQRTADLQLHLFAF